MTKIAAGHDPAVCLTPLSPKGRPNRSENHVLSAWTTGPSDPIMGQPIQGADPGQKQEILALRDKLGRCGASTSSELSAKATEGF